jgi:hypothetical protein
MTAEQVAAARAYVLNNPDEVLTQHRQIEARIAQGNPPEVIEKATKTHATFVNFKKWLAERDAAAAQEHTTETNFASDANGSKQFPSFKEWIAEHDSQSSGAS